MAEREQVSDYWGVDRSQAVVSWLQHPVILSHVHRRVSGDPFCGTYEYWRRRFFPAPAGRALSLGCGFGAFERATIQSGMVARYDAHDISEGAIAQARRQAAAEGLGGSIDYRVTDLNDFRLPPATYDAIFAISSVHHVYNLEQYFRECAKALKPGAMLFIDEYIGPTRFQASPLCTDVINRVLAILPERLCRNALAGGHVRRHYTNSPVEHFERTDPSEAVRSGEIVSTLKLYFDIVDFKPYGGAILHMLLSGIAGNFDLGDETDVALLQTLALLEETLEKGGLIAPDFAAIVARPRIA